MIRRFWLLAGLCCMLSGAFAQHQSSSTQPPSGWTSSYSAAASRAAAAGRPLVLLFVHHGCPECDRMDYYLQSDESRRALRNAYKVRVEFTHHPALVQQFGVTHTPTFIVVSRGAIVYREVGAIPPDRMGAIGRSIDSMVRPPAKLQKRTSSNRR